MVDIGVMGLGVDWDSLEVVLEVVFMVVWGFIWGMVRGLWVDNEGKERFVVVWVDWFFKIDSWSF